MLVAYFMTAFSLPCSWQKVFTTTGELFIESSDTSIDQSVIYFAGSIKNMSMNAILYIV